MCLIKFNIANSIPEYFSTLFHPLAKDPKKLWYLTVTKKHKHDTIW